ncbi:hypothetical protein HanRHA438_Chr07g0313011 [Helianthus annuus]|nr:hypothetical protein HanHA300_Chr07g0249651 [Helianthus annuus]KAJ0563738.1 hypothetical protein HanHA89_Chr07g0266471 [Helianthus annuus]KAJ0731819.1 hypothetical protein HanOQP8_Chr07g0256261 [Helianthus annuus]KAJ0908671.1 hypothetical protein HanRHA438_Chr07g0313011 [Helianthus annuus]
MGRKHSGLTVATQRLCATFTARSQPLNDRVWTYNGCEQAVNATVNRCVCSRNFSVLVSSFYSFAGNLYQGTLNGRWGMAGSE